jgi:hypothetical protein
MGATISIPKVNYEDIQYGIDNNSIYLIHTFQSSNDNCLIKKSLNAIEEEQIINQLLKNTDKSANMVIYGKNTNDEAIIKKYNQLMQLGFKNVYIYPGGLFEWLLLQDIYGSELFPTTTEEKDLLKYKSPKRIFNHYLK